MSTRVKVLLVVAGYIAAFIAASAALSVRLAATNTPQAQAESGMYAFGDFSLFVAVFFVVALVPTGAALFFLRTHRGLWIAIALAGLAIAMTGVAGLAFYVFARTSEWGMFAPLRMLAAPLFALGFFMSALIAPHRFPRFALLAAAACEVAVTAYIAVVWFGPNVAR